MNSPILYNDPSGHMIANENGSDGKKGCADRDYCEKAQKKSDEEREAIRNSGKDGGKGPGLNSPSKDGPFCSSADSSLCIEGSLSSEEMGQLQASLLDQSGEEINLGTGLAVAGAVVLGAVAVASLVPLAGVALAVATGAAVVGTALAVAGLATAWDGSQKSTMASQLGLASGSTDSYIGMQQEGLHANVTVYNDKGRKNFDAYTPGGIWELYDLLP